MKKNNKLVLTNEEVMNTFGGYAPPEGWWADIINPPTVPSEPNRSIRFAGKKTFR